jgi:hypothetical protein
VLNPVTYTEDVVADFLRYQASSYPFADERLHTRLRELLALEDSRRSPLMRGPYVSLARAFLPGASLEALGAEGILHPHVASLTPHPQSYAHQEEAWRAAHRGQSVVVSTGTGSGKTECFLYPVISRALHLRDRGAPAGVCAVIVYPMNALAEDQLGRLRELLCGSGVTFGMYTGTTPERRADVRGLRLPAGTSRQEYRRRLDRQRGGNQSEAIRPPEERASREEMRAPGGAPRILLTNVKQLELLLTRQRDIEIFEGATLDFLVVDEAHTFTGAIGAETAALVRRLRTFCGRGAHDTTCIATSATITGRDGSDAGRTFASRFFGVNPRTVAVVGERYAAESWPTTMRATTALAGDTTDHLAQVLRLVGTLEDAPQDHDAARDLLAFVRTLTGAPLNAGPWAEALHDRLAELDIVREIATALRRPLALADLLPTLRGKLGRATTEEEALLWLTLGAAARKEGRPLLRPVMHAFVRGISGAVATFPSEDAGPKLWLSADDVPDTVDAARLPVTTCTTCGQHYFVHHVADFSWDGGTPSGGTAAGSSTFWPPMSESQGGSRIILVDRIVAGSDDDGDAADDAPTHAGHASLVPVALCRSCGAVHPEVQPVCAGCGARNTLFAINAVRASAKRPDRLTSCLGCRATGRTMVNEYREPARPVRAVAVADVHVIAQSMIQHAERRRLLVFADNRQDAAFQAGWMLDHARRYRLRSLLSRRLRQGTVPVGDLVSWMEAALDEDDELSRAMLPEVWRVQRKDGAPREHERERRLFLRIQVMRELSTGSRQRIGLEPWGRLRVDYPDLVPSLPFAQAWAPRLGTTPERVVDGLASLLDAARRGRILHDSETNLYGRYWHDSDREVQRGYFQPIDGGPRGLKLRRDPSDTDARVAQWISTRGTTVARQVARRWGVSDDDTTTFLEEAWTLLADELGILVPVTLTGGRSGALPGAAGVYQINVDKLVATPHSGTYRCGTCRRAHARSTPNDACMAYRCPGTLRFEAEDARGENYDLRVLDADTAMVRPREHSAQVPATEREVIERDFKSPGDRVNTLVCTPTLELGVDIGALDAVLMRNVPPLPANYWQRAGRAGRRHRMAVNLTYARPTSHDRAYFDQPEKLLHGPIEPPSFNLRNDELVRKHVHAAAITQLFREARDAGTDSTVAKALATCLPAQVGPYFFDGNEVRTTPFDLGPLREAITAHRQSLVNHAVTAFTEGWPVADASVVAQPAIERHVDGMADDLVQVLATIRARLQWALDQLVRINARSLLTGAPDPDDVALRTRCERMINRLRGTQRQRRREAEGFDDTNTYAVLAAEGFLPGYGLDTGSVVATHQAPRDGLALGNEWEIRRGLPQALREYVPGNLIYANGHRFLPRFFRLDAEAPLRFTVDPATESVALAGEAGAIQSVGIAAATMDAVAMCDVELPHQSHISDDEDYRFQLPVAIFGQEQQRHGPGRAWDWGNQPISFRQSVWLRLVNVGPARRVQSDHLYGYPMCTVCGQTRSPFSSDEERRRFAETHYERCGKPVNDVGFYADVVADTLTIRGCATRKEGYSIAEALRQGAARVLDMDVEDIQLLGIGRPGATEVDMLLYDPMPGGSGLLEQMIDRWADVVASAHELVASCPSKCDVACIDCLLRFRNAFYHRHLDRYEATRRLESLGAVVKHTHDIASVQPAAVELTVSVTDGAQRLRDMLRRADLAMFHEEHPITIGPPHGRTTPDFFFPDPTDRYEGICIYLDGLGRSGHGDPVTQARDASIRDTLRNHEYEVISISHTDLTDREAMARYFGRIGRALVSRTRADELRADTSWFDDPPATAHSTRHQGPPLDGTGGPIDHTPPTGNSTDFAYGESYRAWGESDRAWGEAIGYADPRWSEFLQRLRDAGVPPPAEVDADLQVRGRVAARAIAFWDFDATLAAVVATPAPADVSAATLVVATHTAPADVVAFLRATGGFE